MYRVSKTQSGKTENASPARKKKIAEPTKSLAWVDADLGNALCKVRNHNLKNVISIYPHALHYLSEAQFQKVSLHQRSKDNNESLSIFKVHDRLVAIGERAEAYGQIERRSGPMKYSVEYYAPLVIRGLLEIYPAGHDNLAIFAGHSPLDVDYLDNLEDSLLGQHVVETLDGNEVSFVIRKIQLYDEPIGGLMNVLLSSDYRPDFQERILVIDIGGQVSSMTPVNSDGEVFYDLSRPLDVGINNVLDRLSQELRSEYPDYFRSMRTIPRDRLREAVSTGQYRGGGRDIGVLPQVQIAISDLLNQVQSAYHNNLGGPNAWDMILITGGGGGVTYQMLTNSVLEHNNIYCAAEPDEMHLANLYGAGRMLDVILGTKTR